MHSCVSQQGMRGNESEITYIYRMYANDPETYSVCINDFFTFSRGERHYRNFFIRAVVSEVKNVKQKRKPKIQVSLPRENSVFYAFAFDVASYYTGYAAQVQAPGVYFKLRPWGFSYPKHAFSGLG